MFCDFFYSIHICVFGKTCVRTSRFIALAVDKYLFSYGLAQEGWAEGITLTGIFTSS